MYAIFCSYLFIFFIRLLCRTVFWWTLESPQGTSNPTAACPSFLCQNHLIWNGWDTVQRGRKDPRDWRQTEQIRGSLAPRPGRWGFPRETRYPCFHPISYCWLSKENASADWGEGMALREFPSQYTSAFSPYYVPFFSFQDFCIAVCSAVAHFFQWSLLQSCSAKTYLTTASGATGCGTQEGRGGDKHLQMNREQQTLRTSNQSSTGSFPHHSSLGIWCRKLKLRKLPLLMRFCIGAESHFPDITGF